MINNEYQNSRERISKPKPFQNVGVADAEETNEMKEDEF